MKKLLIYIGCLIGFSVALYSASIIEERATSWRTGTVSVSTQTQTAVTCGDTAPFSSRFRIVIQNPSSNYVVSVGTYPTFSYANGYFIGISTSGYSVLSLPLQSGTTVWALGQGQNLSANVTIQCIEYK